MSDSQHCMLCFHSDRDRCCTPNSTLTGLEDMQVTEDRQQERWGCYLINPANSARFLRISSLHAMPSSSFQRRHRLQKKHIKT